MGGNTCSTAVEITRDRRAWKKKALGWEEIPNVKWHIDSKRKEENTNGESHDMKG